MNCNPRIVIALGGNALQSKDSEPTAEAQLEVVRHTCERIADISCAGYEMAVVHGNGPQVGRIVLASETAKDVVPPMPFDVCGAMSQGYIGYHIQQCLHYALAKRNRNVPVVTLATQMVVEQSDPAFQNPTKPIGAFYSQEEARRLEQEKGYAMREDAGRGWRRVVASPLPRRIVEISAVQKLWEDTIVITCGGGGIPVVEHPDGSLSGVAAVIDKDFAAELLAEQVHADVLGQAGPEGPEPPDPGGGGPLCGRGPLRRGQHAAQGAGSHEVRSGPPGPQGHHHQPGQGAGCPGGQDRHRGDLCVSEP